MADNEVTIIDGFVNGGVYRHRDGWRARFSLRPVLEQLGRDKRIIHDPQPAAFIRIPVDQNDKEIKEGMTLRVSDRLVWVKEMCQERVLVSSNQNGNAGSMYVQFEDLKRFKIISAFYDAWGNLIGRGDWLDIQGNQIKVRSYNQTLLWDSTGKRYTRAELLRKLCRKIDPPVLKPAPAPQKKRERVTDVPQNVVFKINGEQYVRTGVFGTRLRDGHQVRYDTEIDS